MVENIYTKIGHAEKCPGIRKRAYFGLVWPSSENWVGNQVQQHKFMHHPKIQNLIHTFCSFNFVHSSIHSQFWITLSPEIAFIIMIPIIFVIVISVYSFFLHLMGKWACFGWQDIPGKSIFSKMLRRISTICKVFTRAN